MARIRLVHWEAAEAPACIDKLKTAGHQVDYGGEFRDWKGQPCDGYVIDLSRLPSHGREIATALRGSKGTRNRPIVFVGGLPEKVEIAKKQLPDATFTTWPRIRTALKAALLRPIENPIVPAGMMDRYGSRTVAQKLGIKENSSVLLVNAPREHVLGDLPPGAHISGEGPAPVTLCFVRDVEELGSTLEFARGQAARSKLWICWRKGEKKGLNENTVRDQAIALGLVDYKVCSVNNIWSALCFALKQTR